MIESNYRYTPGPADCTFQRVLNDGMGSWRWGCDYRYVECSHCDDFVAFDHDREGDWTEE